MTLYWCPNDFIQTKQVTHNVDGSLQVKIAMTVVAEQIPYVSVHSKESNINGASFRKGFVAVNASTYYQVQFFIFSLFLVVCLFIA
ncbi:hypothetical protein ACHQM5_016865 [Ranunculus cassubicifolius]